MSLALAKKILDDGFGTDAEITLSATVQILETALRDISATRLDKLHGGNCPECNAARIARKALEETK